MALKADLTVTEVNSFGSWLVDANTPSSIQDVEIALNTAYASYSALVLLSFLVTV